MPQGVANHATQTPTAIPRSVASTTFGPTDHFIPVFAFDFVDDNKFCLWDADKDYHKSLISTLKQMRKLSWSEIKSHHGLQMKRIITRQKLPPTVSQEITLLEIRVSQEGRVHGFRVNELFQILWFDPTHDVCPEDKIKR